MSGVEEVQVVQTGPSFPVSVDSSVLPSTFADGRFSPGNGGGVGMLLPFILGKDVIAHVPDPYEISY